MIQRRWTRLTRLVLAPLLAACIAGGALAQHDLSGKLSTTYRHGGTAAAAVVSLADGTLVYVTPEPDSDVVHAGEFAWHMSADGSVILLERTDPTSAASGLIHHVLATGVETPIEAPHGGSAIPSTARVDSSGDRVVFLYHPAGSESTRMQMLGIWEGGTVRPLAGDPNVGIFAFALGADGALVYVARPTAPEDAPPELFATHLHDHREVRSMGPIPTELPLVIDSSTTSLTVSADGGRIAFSTAERLPPVTQPRFVSFGMDLERGTAFPYTEGDRSGHRASISPDGNTVILLDTEGLRLISVPFDDPDAAAIFSDPIGGGLDRPVAWSPDGSHIAYGGLSSEGWHQAFVRPVDGGDPIQITSFDEGLWNGSLTWSD